MAVRKQAIHDTEVREDLAKLLAEKRGQKVTEEELHEQRISFAFGNAMNLERITKDSIRTTSQNIRLRA